MRTIRRLVRGRHQRWILAALAAIAVLLIGLLSQGFLNSPGDGSADPTLGAAGPPSASAPARRASTTPAAKSHPRHGQYPQGIPRSIRDKLPDNPLNHLHGALHEVTIRVTSAAQVSAVGYLVPTGLSHVYGTAHPGSMNWSLTQRAVGPGYLAAVFVQANRAGARVTCTVTVDGRRTDSERAASPYARAVCLG